MLMIPKQRARGLALAQLQVRQPVLQLVLQLVQQWELESVRVLLALQVQVQGPRPTHQ